MYRRLLEQLAEPYSGEELFDHLADIVYFMKNAAGEYVLVNRTLVERCGLKSKQDLVGRTPSEVMRQPLGNSFADQDKKVLSSGVPLRSHLELQVYASGDVGWCLTTKLPLFDRAGKVIGLVGISQDLRLPDLKATEYKHVAAAIAYAEQHLDQPPTVEQLATLAGMSRFQLDRRMRQVFGLTTGQWLIQRRIDLAQRRLQQTDDSIAAVALASGYADQSAFTRQFRSTTGMSPRDYRLSNRSPNDGQQRSD